MQNLKDENFKVSQWPTLVSTMQATDLVKTVGLHTTITV